MSNQVLDTRDLAERRDELKEQIFNSFIETFEHYAEQTESFDDILFDEDEIESWVDDWKDELEEIEEVDELEKYITDFQYGETLIHESYFTEYCEELCKDFGYISKDFPLWIEIDWDSTAENIKIDYSECTYQGETYYAR